jgi:hypothetical protein
MERDRGRASRLLIAILERSPRLTVPAGVLAQVWRDGRRQARLARLLKLDHVEVVPLDGPSAQAVGALIGSCGHSDIVDVHVALCARRLGQTVATSDPEDLRRVDPGVSLLPL